MTTTHHDGDPRCQDPRAPEAEKPSGTVAPAPHATGVAPPCQRSAVAIETLIEAKRRGVDVRIMVSGIRNDNWLARHNSVRLLGRPLAAGIEIQEFNRTMLHQKTMVVDRRWVTVGTTNFDNRSFAHNEESNVCVFDRRLAEQLHDIFLDDLSGSERVTVERWTRRGVWARAQEFVASFLQEQA